MGSTSLPDAVRRLLWDIDPKALDLARHGDYLLERMWARGEWAAMCWLRATVPGEQLADFVRRRGHRLAPREQAYWALISGVDILPRRGGGAPPWAGGA